jgi:hypothetical protein
VELCASHCTCICNKNIVHAFACVCVRAWCVLARVVVGGSVRVCVRACVRACMRVGGGGGGGGGSRGLAMLPAPYDRRESVDWTDPCFCIGPSGSRIDTFSIVLRPAYTHTGSSGGGVGLCVVHR